MHYNAHGVSLKLKIVMTSRISVEMHNSVKYLLIGYYNMVIKFNYCLLDLIIIRSCVTNTYLFNHYYQN